MNWGYAALALGLALGAKSARAATLSVGPKGTFPTPCKAVAAAAAGDTIEVDASGSYVGDVCSWSTDGLTLRSVNGRAKIDAGGKNAEGKGIWVIHAANATVIGFEMFGEVLDTSDINGAAIRHQGLNLTVDGCYIHDNQNGILGGPINPDGSDASGHGVVKISRSEFANNGVVAEGHEHNMYIGHYAQFWLSGSFSHDSKEGHLVKSRAYENHILYNRLWDGDAQTPSYEIDLPDGGLAFIIGNVIEQNTTTHNPNIIAYSEESTSNPGHDIFVVNNTIINGLPSGGAFVFSNGPNPPVLTNNVFFGPGTVCTQSSAVLTTNSTSAMPGFVNAAAHDFHLVAGSPLIDKGSDPGMGDGQSLAPTAQYREPTDSESRSVVGAAIDIGAFEFGDMPTSGDDAGASGDAGSSGDAAGGGDAGMGGGGGDSSMATDGGSDAAAGGATAGAGGCGCRLVGGSHVATSSRTTLTGFVLMALGAGIVARRKRR